MKSSEFIFNCITLFDHKYHKISLKRGRLYIDCPDWIKNKKTTINFINNDKKCSQYPATVVLNYEEIKKYPQKISTIKSFINTMKKQKDIRKKYLELSLF